MVELRCGSRCWCGFRWRSQKHWQKYNMNASRNKVEQTSANEKGKNGVAIKWQRTSPWMCTDAWAFIRSYKPLEHDVKRRMKTMILLSYALVEFPWLLILLFSRWHELHLLGIEAFAYKCMISISHWNNNSLLSTSTRYLELVQHRIQQPTRDQQSRKHNISPFFTIDFPT